MSIIDKLKAKFNETFPDQNEPPITPKEKTITVHMQDGTVEEYPEKFIITDGENCVVCMGQYYHTSLGCDSLHWEWVNSSNPIKGMYIKDAKKQKITYCEKCSRDNYLIRHGREDELE